MHAGDCALDGAQNIPVEESIQISRQSALDANFRRSFFPCVASFRDHVVPGKRVGIRRVRSLAKAAKAAAHKTDVSKINVAIDDVSNRFAHRGAPHLMGNRYQRIEGRACCGREQQALLEAQLRAFPRRFEAFAHFAGARSERVSQLRFFHGI